MRLLAVLLLAVALGRGQTTVAEPRVIGATGKLATGQIRITATTIFVSPADGETVGTYPVWVPVVNGAWSVVLEPNAPATAYAVHYQLSGAAARDEYWVVPSTTATLGRKDVVVAYPAGPNPWIQPGQILQGAAAYGQALVWNGASWAPGTVSGGGGGGGGLNYAGVWSSGSTYAAEDVVYYAGSSYVALQAGTGRTPNVSPTYWAVMAAGAAGAPGAAGATGATGPQGPAGGGSGVGTVQSYLSGLIAGPDTTRTITGATHGLAATGCPLMVSFRDAGSGSLTAGYTVDPGTCDVTVSFASPESNYYVIMLGVAGTSGGSGSPLALSSLTNGQLAALTNGQLAALTN